MGNRVKRLPGAAVRYFVEEPLMMIPIGEYQQIVEHLTSMGNLGSYDEKQAERLRQEHRLFLAQTREKLRAAKAYYKIKN